MINCAAWTDVDGAEANEAGATLLNGEAVRLLASACREHGAMLVHYSTDYVFNGEASEPYAIDTPREPLNAYGRSKAVGEAALEHFLPPSQREGAGGGLHESPSRREGAGRGSHETPSRREGAGGGFSSSSSVPRAPASLSWLCLRTSWLYAPWGKNFLRTIAAAALARPQLKVVNDQRGRPTSAEHLARVSLAMIDAGARGMHHATDGGECTWFDFAACIVDHLRETLPRGTPIATVEPCSSAEFPRPAKRPSYSVLDITPTEALIGPMADWSVHVRDALDRRE